ncbi:hypothetical protein MT418_001787 [Batrachochytrium dendrobatidis]
MESFAQENGRGLSYLIISYCQLHANSPFFIVNHIRYYQQLTAGCGVSTCKHRLCASYIAGPRLTPDAAAIMTMQLASRPKEYFCPNISADPQIVFPDSFSFSPFDTPKATPSGSGNHSRSNSYQDLGLHGQLSRRPLVNAHAADPLSTNPLGLSNVANNSFEFTPTIGPLGRPLASVTPSNPFLHSLLFASLFKSPNPARSTENVQLVQSSGEPFDQHSLRKPYDSTVPSSLRRATDSTPCLPSTAAVTIPTESDVDALQCTSLKTREGDAILTRGISNERSSSVMDLPSLLSATMALSQRALWGSSDDVESDNYKNASQDLADDPSNYSELSSPAPELESEVSNLYDESLPDEESQISLAYLTFDLLRVAVETYTSPLQALTHLEADTLVSSIAQNQLKNDTINSNNGWYISDKLDSLHVTSDVEHQSSKDSTSMSESNNTTSSDSPDTSTPQLGAAGDPTFLTNTLGAVFSSVEALTKSFLLSDQDIKSNSSMLDIPSIRKSYHLILKLSPPDLFQIVLANALELLFAKLLLNAKKLRNAESDLLRVIMITVENPLLMDPRYYESLLKKLCQIIGILRSKSRAVLVLWFSEYDNAGFEKIIRIFQQYIVEHVHSAPVKPDQSVIGATKMLSILSHANETAPTPITPFTTFHMPNLAQKLNFKEEYRAWKHSLEAQRVFEFSFFNYPFLFDPIAKTRIMHIDARVQMSHKFEDAYVNQALMQHAQRFLQDSPSVATLEQELKRVTNPYLVLEVRRDRLVDDVLDQIRKKEADLKKPVKVRFVGGGEEGQDQGGVQKEFFQAIVSQLLDPGYGMFVYEEETRSSWINGASLEPERQFELVGIIIGLALYNGVMLGLRFPLLLYKKLVDVRPTFQDFRDAFPTLGRGLQSLLDWSDGDVSDIFLRNFEISYEVYGQVKTYPLVRNGEDIPVTNDNRVQYVELYVQHYTNESIKRQFQAFCRGFHKVVGGKVLKMCRPEELELLICGNTTAEIDFTELEHTAEYDGFLPHDEMVVWFWEIMHKMDLDQKRKLLNFVTASDRVPLSGFSSLTFVVQRNGPDTDRLPTALTCFGRLLLPEYASKEKLFDRLTTAIENATGFGLV